MPKTAKDDPIRAKDLIDNVEPRCKKSITDKDEPIRAKDLIDKDAPR
jgi:hypothetical protein